MSSSSPKLWQSITITGQAKTDSSFPGLIAKNARHIRYLKHVYDDIFSHATSNFPLVLTRLVRLDVTHLTGLWAMALIRSRLSVLSLRIMDTRYLPTQDILLSTRFPKMKQLSLKSRLQGTTSEMLRFIHHCPNLTHLEIDSAELYGEPKSIQGTVTASLKPLLTQLKKLSINGMSDHILASLWQELPLATYLLAEAYGIECNRFLMNPINRVWACQLRELNISHSIFGGTINASEVLTICSGLRKFVTTHIDVKDMMLPGIPVDYSLESLRPWACLELEELNAEFITTALDPNSCISLVCTQIAKLKHLRSLNLEPVFRVFRGIHQGLPALRFTLGKGLELLATLTRLEYLHLGNDVTIETTQDLDWMMEHLPSLREVRGALNRDSERSKELHKHIQEPCARAPGRWFKVDPPPINHFTFGAASSSNFTRNSIATTTVEPPALYSGSLSGDTSASTTSTRASAGSLFGTTSIFGPVPLFGSASTSITPAFGASTSSLLGAPTPTTSIGASTGSLFGNTSASTTSSSGAGTPSLFGTVRTSTTSAGASTGSRFGDTSASTTSSFGASTRPPFGNTRMSTTPESGARAAPLFGTASTSTTRRFGAPAVTSAPEYSDSALSAASLGLALLPAPTVVTPTPLSGPFGSTTIASASFGTTVTAAPQPFACSITARSQPFPTTGAQVNLSPSGAAPAVNSSTGFSAQNSSVPNAIADDSDL
ncbi:hypothetical protein CPB97_011040 [Podila verticillata]|nr:hypothetical protein CPB97_011040 [Podila verticillata]